MFSLPVNYRWLTRVVGQIRILTNLGFRRRKLIFRDLPPFKVFISNYSYRADTNINSLLPSPSWIKIYRDLLSNNMS